MKEKITILEKEKEIMNNYFMPHAKKKFFIEPSKVIYIYIEIEREKKRGILIFIPRMEKIKEE